MPGENTKGLRKAVLLPLLLLLLTLALAAWWTLERARIIPLPYTLGHVVGATYVGSEKCAQCHLEIYTQWQQSGHSKVILVADEVPGAILGDFSKLAEFLEQENLARFDQRDVVLIHGNLWKQNYVNKKWQVLPALWNIREEKWQAHRPQDWEKQDWRKSCAFCHVTGFELSKLRWQELGVGCEACHGPGSRHLDASRREIRRTIVNPKLLTPDMAADICGQCHTRGRTPDNKHGFPVGFVPGMKLLPKHFIPVPKDNPKAWWPDGSPRQHRVMFQEWKQSKHREAGVTCITCHSPHRRVHKFATRKTPNQLCIGCHAGVSTDPIRGHAPIQGAPQHSNCIACHMAPTGKIANYGEERVHTFRVIQPRVTVEHGGGDPAKQPNSCNHCHAHRNDSPARLQRALEDGLRMKHRQKPG